MKPQILFSRKHRKNVSKCSLLKFLPSVKITVSVENVLEMNHDFLSGLAVAQL